MIVFSRITHFVLAIKRGEEMGEVVLPFLLFFYKAYDLLSCCKLLPETTRNVYHHKRIWVYDDYLRPF